MEVQKTKIASKPTRAELAQLKVLTFDEGCIYTGYAPSYMYKLTSSGIVPHGKPNGKSIFFDREQLESWMLSNPSTTQAEKESQAATYITTTDKRL